MGKNFHRSDEPSPEPVASKALSMLGLKYLSRRGFTVDKTKRGITIAVVLTMACLQAGIPQSPDPQLRSAAPDVMTIPSGQNFILQLDTPLHTRTTRKGDKVEFHIAADVVVESRVVIADRSLIRGTVTKSKRAGLLFGRAELQMQFDEVQLADGTVLPLRATITRAGFDPVGSKSGEPPKIQGDPGQGGEIKAMASAGAQGALIGVLQGGPRGAIYGAAAGVAIAGIATALKRGPDVDLPRSTMFEARFDKPLEIPETAVPVRNAPAVASLRDAKVSGAPDPDAAANEPQAARPVLKRIKTEPLKEEASNSAPEVPDSPASPASSGSPATPDVSAKTSTDAGGGGVTISVKVKMVQVDTIVRDRSGRTMQNLRMDDFRVYEDKVLQDIASLSQDELPLAVALVIDRSGSVSPYIAELRRIATRALYDLKPQDQVCLYSFAADVEQLQDLTADRERIVRAIDRIRTGGGTNIMDALHEAVRYLASAAPDRRHAVILVSDNQQTASPRTSEREVINAALETDTVLYSLKTSGEPIALGNQLPSLIFGDSVHKVAQETGGEVIKVSRSTLDGALGAVISRLRMRYTIGYYPSSGSQGGAFHSITVRLTDKFGKAGQDYTIQAKRGYYAVGPRI
jgi:VWFA-related protein